MLGTSGSCFQVTLTPRICMKADHHWKQQWMGIFISRRAIANFEAAKWGSTVGYLFKSGTECRPRALCHCLSAVSAHCNLVALVVRWNIDRKQSAWKWVRQNAEDVIPSATKCCGQQGESSHLSLCSLPSSGFIVLFDPSRESPSSALC